MRPKVGAWPQVSRGVLRHGAIVLVAPAAARREQRVGGRAQRPRAAPSGLLRCCRCGGTDGSTSSSGTSSRVAARPSRRPLPQLPATTRRQHPPDDELRDRAQRLHHRGPVGVAHHRVLQQHAVQVLQLLQREARVRGRRAKEGGPKPAAAATARVPRHGRGGCPAALVRPAGRRLPCGARRAGLHDSQVQQTTRELLSAGPHTWPGLQAAGGRHACRRRRRCPSNCRGRAPGAASTLIGSHPALSTAQRPSGGPGCSNAGRAEARSL